MGKAVIFMEHEGNCWWFSTFWYRVFAALSIATKAITALISSCGKSCYESK